METIKINKTIEEMPFKKGVDLILRVLEKPEGKNQEEWKGQIEQDLLTGKKFFTIRELKLSQQVDG